MPDLFLERHVPHLPARMFELVSDLERYPRFVPNCRDMRVRRDPAQPATEFATMTIQFGPISQSYTSKVVGDPAANIITATAVDGPFAYLNSKWTFEPEGEGTLIRFDLDFKISNPLIAAVAEPAFAAKQDEIIDAFCEEADRRFGG